MTTTYRTEQTPPCKDCVSRYPGCSDHCQKPEYQAWRAERDRIKKNMKSYMPPVWKHGETDPANYRDGKKKK